MAPVYCPLCRSEIRLTQLNLSEATYLCVNEKCTYPLNDQNQKLEIIQRNYKELARQTIKINETPPDNNNVAEFDINLIDSNLDEYLNSLDQANALPDSIEKDDLEDFDKFLQSL